MAPYSLSINPGKYKMKQQASDMDAHLFELLRKGDFKALVKLQDIFSNAIYLYAYNILGSQEEAEDVTAQSFITLWRDKENMESPRHVKDWLYLVTRNACIDILRQRKRSRNMQRVVSAHYVSDYFTDTGAADLRILKAEIIAEVVKEVEKLPTERMRRIFVLRFIQQKKPAQVAEMMKIATKIVYDDSQKARQFIKIALLRKGLDTVFFVIIASLLYL